MKILLMGATGNAGTPAVKALQAKGIRPTVAVRDIEKAQAKLGAGVDYVPFDYFAPATYHPTLEGVDRLFLIAPPPTKDPQIVKQIVQLAHEKGVQLVVFQSGNTSGRIKGKPLHTNEQNLKASDINWCILRPGWFMQNFHSWMGTHLEEGELVMPTGDGKVAFIDTQDLGAAIAEVVSTDGHEGKTYTLTGPESLDHYQVASILSESTGKKIEYLDLSEEAYIQKVVQKGWSEKNATYAAYLFRLVREGSEAETSEDLRTLLGRKPRTFREFAKDEF